MNRDPYYTLATLLNARGQDKGIYFTHEECSYLYNRIELLMAKVKELEAENGRLRCGIIDKTEPEKFDENIAALTKAMSDRFKDEDPEEFFRNLRG